MSLPGDTEQEDKVSPRRTSAASLRPCFVFQRYIHQLAVCAVSSALFGHGNPVPAPPQLPVQGAAAILSRDIENMSREYLHIRLHIRPPPHLSSDKLYKIQVSARSNIKIKKKTTQLGGGGSPAACRVSTFCHRPSGSRTPADAAVHGETGLMIWRSGAEWMLQDKEPNVQFETNAWPHTRGRHTEFTNSPFFISASITDSKQCLWSSSRQPRA